MGVSVKLQSPIFAQRVSDSSAANRNTNAFYFRPSLNQPQFASNSLKSGVKKLARLYLQQVTSYMGQKLDPSVHM